MQSSDPRSSSSAESQLHNEVQRERGTEGQRERERERDRGTEGGRERGTEGQREGDREGQRERERERGTEGKREREIEISAAITAPWQQKSPMCPNSVAPPLTIQLAILIKGQILPIKFINLIGGLFI